MVVMDEQDIYLYVLAIERLLVRDIYFVPFISVKDLSSWSYKGYDKTYLELCQDSLPDIQRPTMCIGYFSRRSHLHNHPSIRTDKRKIS